MKNNKTTQNGTSGAMLLFIVFLILKLTGVIGWSWWWVTAPLWGGIAIGLIAVVCILGFVLTLKALGK